MVEPEELVRFCQLLRSLLCGDNEHRKESERLYQATKQRNPDGLCRCLLAVLTQAPDDTLRQQSAVLLRQCLKSTRGDFIWPRVPPETQEAIKSQLVSALRSERVKLTRHKICDAVSMLACHVLDAGMAGGGWTEIGHVLSELVEADDSTFRESALRIVKEMLAVNPPVVQSLVDGKMPRVLDLCQADASLHVRKEAVLLFAAVLEHLPASESDPLRGFMPAMLAIVQQLEGHVDELQECLEAFVQVLDTAPGAFQHHLETVVPMMLTISRAKDRLDDGVRQTAFEFLVSLCERRAKTCARFSGFVREVVQLCMEFMLELEDEDDWAGAADAWRVEVSNYDVGEENVDRFARALGAAAVLDHVFEGVRSFVGSGDWKHRYVAVMTLSQSAETVQLEAHVDEIVRLLLSLLSDGHPRVRYAALHAIGQTSTDHSPYLQEQHSEVVLPALSRLMDDPVVKVASHACAAFVNFAEDLEYELLLPYVHDLMAKLCQKMVSTARVLQEQAITAIAVIAGVIETDFVPYYQQVVPVLKHVVLTATGTEERALRGKAFECMSLLGLAVGREVFQQDAQEAMQAMMETASRGLEADDPQRSYIHEAAQRICRALKEKFLPYLQYLLPGIHAMLQMQPAEVLDPDAEDAEEDMTVAFLTDGKAVGLKTSQIEDFKSAVQLLACFLEVLGGHYFEHVRETARCLLPALSFRFSDDVKREAVQTWQELIAAARAGATQRRLAGDRLVPELLGAYLRGALEAMRAEEDLETLQVQAAGTGACLRAAGPGALAGEEVRELCAELRRLAEESTQRLREAAPAAGLDEDELAEAGQRRDAEQMLRIKYAELAGSVMETHKAHFLQCGLGQLVPLMQECLLPAHDASDRCFALYLASDILEKLGPEGAGTLPVFVGQVLDSLAHDDAWVRQAAAYAVWHAAPLSEFAPFVGRAAALLFSVLGRCEGEGEGQREAAEAGVAALGRVCRLQAGHVEGLDGCLLRFLHGLPLIEDVDQAGPVHELLLELVSEGHPFFRQHAAKVCCVLLEVYNRETSSERLNAGIRHVFRQVGKEQLEQMQPPLSQKQRKKLEKVLRDARRADSA
mmetsp:Transcript_56656/g.165735  ORF Transcript_56656/g.165735 Transcript_56656/m.165735 type:complete len:1086 (+) Transcript_56656:83-3340(+)